MQTMSRLAIAIAAGLALIACGQSAPRMTPIRHEPVVVTADAGVVDATVDAPHDSWTRLPGCSATEAQTRKMEILAIEERVQLPGADPQFALDELRASLKRPCLKQLRLGYTLPKQASLSHVQQVFDAGLATALEMVVEGIYQNSQGERFQTLPPEVMPELDDKQRQAIAPMRCTATEASCAFSQSYIRRAEDAFDQSFRGAYVPANRCEIASDDDEPVTRYDEWIACVSTRSRRNHRFADKALRAPTTGWVVLRGRRGHYQFADELRAYDLATGAAYVATNTGAMIVPAKRTTGLDVYAGRVEPSHLRELAFVLLARDAIVEVRSQSISAILPKDVPLALTPDDESSGTIYGRSFVISSAETILSFTYVDGTYRKTGTFRWPQSSFVVDSHIVDLIEVMEAGLVKGCAPARLPPADKLAGPSGPVSSVDADADALRATEAVLQQALHGLKPPPCKR